MPKLFQNIGEVICGSQKDSSPNRQVITIGDQVFAVAHSREEMARIMRMRDRQVTGYVLQHRM
jgi:hypothetical protein